MGAETLIRWCHPEKGFINTQEFIALAEETDLILPISEWILDKACAQMSEWINIGLNIDHIAVNLSAQQFFQSELVEIVAQSIKTHNLRPEHLELEITESIFMDDNDVIMKQVNELKELGVKLALDDFGTGYSSLSYLERFPIDSLKIDKVFVSKITEDNETAILTNTIIAMAKCLNLKVTAEGVETAYQYQYLSEQLCEEVQGYFFCEPKNADRVTKYIKNFNEIPKANLVRKTHLDMV